MRFAISAVAAASGLLLLGLSFFGQPAVYLHQAGEQWNALMDRPAADQSVAPDAASPAAPSDQVVASLDRAPVAVAPSQAGREDDGAVARAERLQQEVLRLQRELAARQRAQTEAPPPQAVAPPAVAPPAVAPPVSAPPAPTLQAAAPPAPAPQAAAPQAAAPQAATPPAPAPQAAAPQAAAPQAAAPQAASQAAAPQAPAPAEPAAGRPAVVASAARTMVVQAPTAATPATVPAPEPALPVPPAVPIPERRVAETQTAPPVAERQPEPVKVEPPKPEPAKTATVRNAPPKAEPVKVEPPSAEPPKIDLARAEPSRAEPSRQALPKIALQKPIPAPPPLPQPSPPRQDAEDTQSVLARLRQLGPGAPPEQQAAATPAPDIRPRPVMSPLLPRLGAAQAALANGRVEDARRLLQQTQLQLVFGPVDGSGEEIPNAGRSATDVARALDALSANDVSLSRRYIEVAMGDLSGNPMNPPIQESARRASGYAPAYPPR